MALSTRTVNFSCTIRLNADGNFQEAHRVPTVQCWDNGTLICQEQKQQISVSLAELKTFVAALT
jgi:hypothetical protein